MIISASNLSEKDHSVLQQWFEIGTQAMGNLPVRKKNLKGMAQFLLIQQCIKGNSSKIGRKDTNSVENNQNNEISLLLTDICNHLEDWDIDPDHAQRLKGPDGAGLSFWYLPENRKLLQITGVWPQKPNSETVMFPVSWGVGDWEDPIPRICIPNTLKGHEIACRIRNEFLPMYLPLHKMCKEVAR